MSITQDALALGGSTSRQPTSTWMVSAWHVPGGYDYVNAYSIYLYFDEAKPAQDLAEKYDRPNELAIAFSVEDHDRIQKLAKKANHHDRHS